VCFPAIHEGIHTLVKELDEVSRKLIDKFYDDYDNEIINHFKYEEEVVFPYIEKLMENNRPNDTQYRIGQFEENHSNINEKLNDLKNIIAKYLDEGYSSPQRFELLNTIYCVENDLRKHSLIENKLLIPLVENLENSHE
jgi:regulator of cell morphogenesis and NO signaling